MNDNNNNSNIGTVQEIVGKRSFRVTIPLTYEVEVDENNEMDKALIEEMGIESVARNKARSMFHKDTSTYEQTGAVIAKNIRGRADGFWNSDVVNVKEQRRALNGLNR